MLTPSYTAQQPIDDFGFVFSPLLYNATLAPNVQVTLSIPNSSPRFKAIIKTVGGSEAWVSLNQPASLPVGNTIILTTSEMINNNNLCREVVAGDVLHFISANTTDVSVVLYSLSTPN